MNQTTNSLEQLHQVEKELLQEVLQIFEEHKITYYVIGGTLLGAIRHGGFIPWDDDIDIAIPRPDYIRLIAIMKNISHPVVGMHYYKTEPELYYYPVRFYHKGYGIQDPRDPDRVSNPWMDLLPIDGMPDGKLSQKLFHFRMLYYRFLLGLYYADHLRDIKRSFLQRVIIRFAQKSGIGRRVDPSQVKDRIDRLLTRHAPQDCKVIGTCMGAYFFHEFVPREMFGRGSSVQFEGLTVWAPEQVHPYLTHMYGDYMKLPPPEARVVHMDGRVWKLNHEEGKYGE